MLRLRPVRHNERLQLRETPPPMAITPSPFMLLEASPGHGPLHFIASTEDGHVQISGRGDRWGAA